MTIHRHCLLAALVSGALLLPGASSALSGGPDAFGYTFEDTHEPGGPTYSWFDITASGTPLELGDDGEATLDLPFPFVFYGRTYTDVSVGDGLLVFGDDATIDNENQCVPADNTAGDDALVMGLWHDLDASAGGTVTYEVLGAAPDRTLVVAYDQVAPYDDHGITFTFQILLHEGTHAITLQFASVDGSSDFANGAAATVGIQSDQGVGLEYSCMTDAVLHDELAVRFSVTCEDLDGDGLGACGGDCDDADPAIGPHAAEIDDGVDDDCDGLVDEDFLTAGDVVVTEFMANPRRADDQSGEWFEVLNTSARQVDLLGWLVHDEDGRDGVEHSVVLAPGELALFAADGDSDANGGLPAVDVDYEYEAIKLTNVGATLTLTAGALVLDEFTYDADDWTVQPGRSTYLDAAHADAELNDSPYPWCVTPEEDDFDYGGGPGDHGTPGELNPGDLCCADADGDGSSTCDGDCDDDEPDSLPGLAEVADGLDNDCDGLVDEDFVGPGDVVISEFLDDPWLLDDASAEWLELHNPTVADIDLRGWQLTDAAGTGLVVQTSLVVPAGGHVVLAPSDAASRNGNLPQVDLVYDYGAFVLSSTDDDQIVLRMGDDVIDEVAYSNLPPWPGAPGRSCFLRSDSMDADANDEAASWCLTSADPSFEYGGEDGANYGTPGGSNPTGDEDEDGDGATVCQGDCDDADGDIGPQADELCGDGRDNDCDGWVDGSDGDCAGHTDDDDSAPEETIDDEGCACRTDGASWGGTGWLLAAVIGLLGFRRSR
jgi:hypothetical protein